MKFAVRLYRSLSQALPYEFKVLYGADMLRLHEDVIAERQNGAWCRFRGIADLAVRIPIEYLDEIKRDLIDAARAAAKSPHLTAAVIVLLGLSIGIASMVYSEIRALLSQDLSLVKQPERLVTTEASYPDFEHIRDQRDLISNAAAYVPAVPFRVALDAASPGNTELFYGQIVSPEYFRVLEVRATAGRVFSPEIDKPGGTLMVVISDRFWREHLTLDPGAVGRTLKLNGRTATIVGIAPKGFTGALPALNSDLYVPTTSLAEMVPELGNGVFQRRDAKVFLVLMRLAPGVTLASSEAAFDAVRKRLDESGSDAFPTRRERQLKLSTRGSLVPMTPKMRVVLYRLWGTMFAGMVLSITCMNLAKLLLTPLDTRRCKIAVCLAHGASRLRMIRKLLLESTFLSMSGGLTGMAFAYCMANIIPRVTAPGWMPLRYDILPDWRVIGFAFTLSLIAGIGFRLAPAIAVTSLIPRHYSNWTP